MTKITILHAGPPIEWERMCGPMKGAIYGALKFEELANNSSEADNLITSGQVAFDCCHAHGCVGPMAGVLSASMPVFVVTDKIYGASSFCSMNEGLGKVLRFGAFSDEVIERLNWMRTELGPGLGAAVRKCNGINLKTIISQALLMGDECHNRNVASTSLFERRIVPYLIDSELDRGVIYRIVEFMEKNDHFFLNLSMAACKAMMDVARDTENCSLVTALARNGTDFGIQVGGLGNRWFIAPAPTPRGLYFPGFGPADANPDLGDSAITETRGIGGFSMAAAPAIVKFIGGNARDATHYTKEMGNITVSKDFDFAIPFLDFDGAPTGIDVIKVLETGIQPVINTGIAHKQPGVGQVGAGIVRAPMECFKKALRNLLENA